MHLVSAKRKRSDGTGISGKKKLTLTCIDNMKTLQGFVLRKQKENAGSMSWAIHAIIKHSNSPKGSKCDHWSTGGFRWLIV